MTDKMLNNEYIQEFKRFEKLFYMGIITSKEFVSHFRKKFNFTRNRVAEFLLKKLCKEY